MSGRAGSHHRPAIAPAGPVVSLADAEALIREVTAVMDELLGILELETNLVRAGRLAEARSLEARKTELAGRYLTRTLGLKASAAQLAHHLPTALASLERRHDLFRALLQINLTVLATAHAVAEGLIRGATEESARKVSPQGYGATGRTPQSPPGPTRPVVVNRSF